MKYLIILMVLVGCNNANRSTSHKKGFSPPNLSVSCLNGVLYYNTGYKVSPLYQKDTIPKLVLCED